ncbi:protein of unknown function DUF569 [Dillenia turbinata]|uniref:DUF569 domain-containing protein n=1 Tax=Dillenia turbinata TaxID=194707 RepID=A0AAN8UMQ0_9MAGN
MELFQKAKAVRLRSHHDKYLLAEDDNEAVCQDRDGQSKNARWTVEIVEGLNVIRLKSCYNKYLTATDEQFLLGVTGKRVMQTLPKRLNSSVEWEPIRDGFQVRLKTRYGNFLRANGGLPPWRNSITHDVPHRTATQDWVLWEVDVLEVYHPPPPPKEPIKRIESDVEDSGPISLISMTPPTSSRLESGDKFIGSPVETDGRIIYYSVVNKIGNVADEIAELSFTFKGSGVEELKEKLKEKTGLDDVIVCSRNPLNGELYPLRLHLPPNNANMHVVIVPSSSKG